MGNRHLLDIIRAGIHEVLPSRLLPQLFTPPCHPVVQSWLKSSQRYLFCSGKAAVTTAQSIRSSASCADFFVLAPEGVPPGSLDPSCIHYGSHPVPNEKSYVSTGNLLQWIDSLPGGGSLLVVLSGGSSALLVHPASGISLEAKVQLNRLLLSCGACIQEINAVRKHCSTVKGGQLGTRVARLHCGVLLISDVIGNDPAVIGSGPFYPDPTTFLEAVSVLRKYGIWDSIPNEIRSHLELGVAGGLKETPKPSSLRVPHAVIASNETARNAAAAAAGNLGYQTVVAAEPVSGFVEEAADRLWARIRNAPPRTAFIFGGEVTVRLSGNGTGGRNQHLALLMTNRIAGTACVFASAGTDGVDGNSVAAGAWTDGQTAQRAKEKGLDVEAAISQFNSYPFFQQLGQSIVTGPTGTNVMDLYVALT